MAFSTSRLTQSCCGTPFSVLVGLYQHQGGRNTRIDIASKLSALQNEHLWALTRRTLDVVEATRGLGEFEAVEKLDAFERWADEYYRAAGLPESSIRPTESPMARTLLRNEHINAFRVANGDIWSKGVKDADGTDRNVKLGAQHGALTARCTWAGCWAQGLV